VAQRPLGYLDSIHLIARCFMLEDVNLRPDGAIRGK
jgi:hypothetical protein